MENNKIIQSHGGYKNLKSYQTATIAQDFTAEFCRRYIDKRSRTHDQMVQAARSGKQNIAEGSQDSGTSSKIEIKLVGVARGSLEELKADYKDFLRHNNLKLWEKDDPRAREIRQLAYVENKSYETYSSYIENPESAANCAITIINQANYLLDRQLKALEGKFLKEGGFTERMNKTRRDRRKIQADRWGVFNKDQQLSPEEFAKKLEEELKDFNPEEE